MSLRLPFLLAGISAAGLLAAGAYAQDAGSGATASATTPPWLVPAEPIDDPDTRRFGPDNDPNVIYADPNDPASGRNVRNTDPNTLYADRSRPPDPRVTRPESPDGLERTVVDPYPLQESVTVDPPTLPEDPAAPREPGLLDGDEPGLGLRRTTNDVAPLTSVVRPVERQAPQLPVTGPIPLEQDPEADARAAYDPLGLRLGSFQINTTATAAIGHSSEDGTFWRSTGEIVARSDWERHGVDFTLRGGLRDGFDGEKKLEPNADVILNGSFAATEVDRIGIGAAYNFSREDEGDAALEGSKDPSDIHVLSGSLGYERNAGIVALALKGAIDRTTYSEGGDRDNTAFSTSVRLTYDDGGMLKPFIEPGLFTRKYDKSKDSAGYERDSVGGEIKAGVGIDTGLLVGEAAIGYALEAPDDERLEDLRGIIAETSLAWAATPLTTVTLKADTRFEPTQVEKATGSVVHSADIGLAYALRPNVLIDVGAGLSYQDYTGIAREVTTTRLSAGIGYKLNRHVELGLDVTHEMRDGDGEPPQETTVEAAVTFRH